MAAAGWRRAAVGLRWRRAIGPGDVAAGVDASDPEWTCPAMSGGGGGFLGFHLREIFGGDHIYIGRGT